MNYYHCNCVVKSFISVITSRSAVDVDYARFDNDDREMLSRMRPFIQEALRLLISEGREIHIFEQHNGLLCIMYEFRGTYHIEHEDPSYTGIYDVGTKFVSFSTNTPVISAKQHESGGRFLDSLVDSMIRRALDPSCSDALFWNIIKLFRSLRDWRDKFILLNREMFDVAAEDNDEVRSVSFRFDGEVLMVYYDVIDDINTLCDFSFNINTYDFIAHTPYTGPEGVVFVKGNLTGEEESEDDKDEE